MPSHLPRTDSLTVLVRAHFALTQSELARFVGVGRTLLAHAEAGRRNLPEAAFRRLLVLARQLPPPEGEGPSAPETLHFLAGTAAADTLALLQRRREVQAALVQEQSVLDKRGLLQLAYERRRWALTTLPVALAAPIDPASRWAAATPNVAQDLGWLGELARETAQATEPFSATEQALRTARLRGLEAELAALDAFLVGTAGAK
ncbi:hypothetical protein LJ737_07090 [Hymenobacter sp. 15J16-1T3B]|uniref:helix-turn-helix domain-containing protein n=1 Tax=Hymenobacter sp. 15J16-1T3B TaxID=2886941 RepID=UPI001D12F4EA|nr:hypothetical protein [Hymenobacter sp. 15J16-1T3B]MCC3156996.1 hypothetical protein [Hymenobacter sp. 15J16-1T3B]